jgi:protein TonB
LNPRSPYLASSILHATVLALAAALSLLHRAPPFVPNVRIVTLGGGGRAESEPAPGRRAQAVERPAPAVVPKPVPPAPVTKPKPDAKSPPERPAAKAAEKTGVKPPAKRDIVSKAPSAAPKPAPAATAGATPAAAPAATASGSGGVGIETDAEPGPLAGYLGLLRDRVAQSWAAPLTAGRRGEVRCVVFFAIARGGGAPQALAVQVSSGDASFDRAAMRAILNAAPLAPLPASWGTDSIGIRFTFFQTY